MSEVHTVREFMMRAGLASLLSIAAFVVLSAVARFIAPMAGAHFAVLFTFAAFGIWTLEIGRIMNLFRFRLSDVSEFLMGGDRTPERARSLSLFAAMPLALLSAILLTAPMARIGEPLFGAGSFLISLVTLCVLRIAAAEDTLAKTLLASGKVCCVMMIGLMVTAPRPDGIPAVEARNEAQETHHGGD